MSRFLYSSAFAAFTFSATAALAASPPPTLPASLAKTSPIAGPILDPNLTQHVAVRPVMPMQRPTASVATPVALSYAEVQAMVSAPRRPGGMMAELLGSVRPIAATPAPIAARPAKEVNLASAR
ncbi:MAG: hypothetical protein JSR24_11520 [Proteobacteria bacterium]|nr:hypothetical protein [Pseudomonadota bacterium]